MFSRVERDDRMVNPCAYMPRPRAELPQPRFLTRASVEAMFRFLQNQPSVSSFHRLRDTAYAAVLLYAGLRRQEALDLYVADVNLDRGTLTVRRGKGRNGGRGRTAYLSSQGRSLLSEYLDARERRKHTHAYFFVSTHEDARMPLIAVRRMFERISRHQGETVTPHMLRHTCATLLREEGTDTRLLMSLMGHRSIAMVTRYAHVFDGEELAAAERVRLRL